MASRHIPPSRRRYQAANPTISTRVDRALYLALTHIAESEAKSLGEVVRDALNAYVESALSAEPPGEGQPEVPATTDLEPGIATATDKAAPDPYLAGLDY